MIKMKTAIQLHCLLKIPIKTKYIYRQKRVGMCRSPYYRTPIPQKNIFMTSYMVKAVCFVEWLNPSKERYSVKEKNLLREN